MKAWIWAGGGVGGYVAMIVVTAIVLHGGNVDHPIMRAVLWPISLTRYLLGGF